MVRNAKREWFLSELVYWERWYLWHFSSWVAAAHRHACVRLIETNLLNHNHKVVFFHSFWLILLGYALLAKRSAFNAKEIYEYCKQTASDSMNSESMFACNRGVEIYINQLTSHLLFASNRTVALKTVNAPSRFTPNARARWDYFKCMSHTRRIQ